MPRPFTPKMITANALRSGHVVYLTANNAWSVHCADAELITNEAHAQIRLLFAEQQTEQVIGAYMADARQGKNGVEPVHFREQFRARGPSNYAHGKQAKYL